MESLWTSSNDTGKLSSFDECFEISCSFGVESDHDLEILEQLRKNCGRDFGVEHSQIKPFLEGVWDCIEKGESADLVSQKQLIASLKWESSCDKKSLPKSKKKDVGRISTSTHWKNPDYSPHVYQVLPGVNAPGYSLHTDIPFARTLDLTNKESASKYRRRTNEVKSVIHWGQRKLLMSEIEFLTNYSGPATGRCLLVYAGAAPGTHIHYLANLFPHVDWELVDPAPFNTIEKSRDKHCGYIKTNRCLFTEELSNEYKERVRLRRETDPDYRFVFVSDVRSVDWQIQSEEETEERVQADMQMQQEWHQQMEPDYSMLKFRLSWKPGFTDYLEGTVYFPVWGPITTTESRLVVKGGAPLYKYNNTLYESQMFYFNTTQRPALYEHDVDDIFNEGLDHCFDCSSEVYILKAYMRHQLDDPDAEISTEKIARMVSEISKEICRNRKLSSPNSDPEERKKGIKSRQWVDGAPAYEHQKFKLGKRNRSRSPSPDRGRKSRDYEQRNRSYKNRDRDRGYDYRDNRKYRDRGRDRYSKREFPDRERDVDRG
eukprot:CAMPEP_0117084552 /NCGR_PEP_ID=MMETSP0472-20121206/59507_1 /TAXON_ID=693140 ORGANISM="Tiarina fusus, Strain LIS" /NCGR_SAMPLE_ID=MMETSP0472 /ASSEMBLY_ACC=CAM_ASM_000603 /LENGTH=543 /DNA_ID=CAMNT_0004813585 /DNA_START=506 /DNA_END=2133 /DNA_ORIENTATION=-